MSYLNSQSYLFSVQYYHHKETGQLIYKAKSVDWFLYDGDTERQKVNLSCLIFKRLGLSKKNPKLSEVAICAI